LRLTLKELDDLCKRKKVNDRRIEQHSAQIACLLYNINRGDSPALKVEDFMTEKAARPRRRIQSADEMKNIAKLITAAFNGEIK